MWPNFLLSKKAEYESTSGLMPLYTVKASGWTFVLERNQRVFGVVSCSVKCSFGRCERGDDRKRKMESLIRGKGIDRDEEKERKSDSKLSRIASCVWYKSQDSRVRVTRSAFRAPHNRHDFFFLSLEECGWELRFRFPHYSQGRSKGSKRTNTPVIFSSPFPNSP